MSDEPRKVKVELSFGFYCVMGGLIAQLFCIGIWLARIAGTLEGGLAGLVR